MKTEIENKHEEVKTTLSEIDSDGDVQLKLTTYRSYSMTTYINKQDAERIINHLKQQFNL
jgi:hypothetical protein